MTIVQSRPSAIITTTAIVAGIATGSIVTWAVRSFGKKINELLEPYERGFELSETGEVLARSDPGLAPLHEAPLPTNDVDNVSTRVAAAQTKFRRHRSTFSDRRDAIRDLADVLEFLRPQLDGVLTNKGDAAL